MAKYRKVPVIIDAYTWDELYAVIVDGKDGGDTLESAIIARDVEYEGNKSKNFIIHTLEGDMKMSQSDMLIVGIKSECYPCKLDVFEKTYEFVSE